MTEDLKKILEESLKNAKKEMASGCMAATSDFLDSIKLAMISQEIGNAIKEHVIVATKFFVEKNNLPKEDFLIILFMALLQAPLELFGNAKKMTIVNVKAVVVSHQRNHQAIMALQEQKLIRQTLLLPQLML